MEKKNCESCGKPISGIVCDVSNCKYHEGTDKCCAQHKLGKLIAARELPILHHAKAVLEHR